MATIAVLAVATLASTAVGVVQQKNAKDAADAQSRNQQLQLDRQREDGRQALIENSRRQQRNKQRQLAQLRANQAASGFNTDTGTQLAIFGEIETRIDEQINEQTSQALDGLGSLQNQQRNLVFADGIRDDAHSSNLLATGIRGATSFASGLPGAVNNGGTSPFNLFN